MGMLIFFAVVFIWAVGSLAAVSERAAEAFLRALALIAVSLLLGAVTLEPAAMLVPPVFLAFCFAAKLFMRWLDGGERPPAS